MKYLPALLLAIGAILAPIPLHSQTGAAAIPAKDRLRQSAAALELFQKGMSPVVRSLLEKSVCLTVAPHYSGEEAPHGINGFLTCREAPGQPWSHPASISIEGGGVLWSVVARDLDLVMLTASRKASEVLKRESVLLSADVFVDPGPVDAPPQNPDRYATLYVYQSTPAGISGLNVGGGTMTGDRTANAAIYGKPLSTAAALAGAPVEGDQAALAQFDSAVCALDQPAAH